MERPLIDEAVRTARERLAEGRKALIEASPAALESCAACLRAGIVSLEQCRDAVADGGSSPRAGTEALRVRTELRLLSRLLEHAAEYHARWMGVANSAWAGYTAAGTAAEVGRRGRLLTQG